MSNKYALPSKISTIIEHKMAYRNDISAKESLGRKGECHSLSYDALTAHVAIVLTRYMLIAMEQRQNEDQRTLGELFFFLVDEIADITFSRSLGILMDTLMASFQVILKQNDE